MAEVTQVVAEAIDSKKIIHNFCGFFVIMKKKGRDFMTQTIPKEYKPISAWGYFGYQLLFGIPIVGFIFLLVFALGGTENINLKNYSRSYFCAFLVGLIIFVVTLAIVGGVAAITGNIN